MKSELFATVAPAGQIRYGLQSEGQVIAEATMSGQTAAQAVALVLVSAAESHAHSGLPWTRPQDEGFRWTGVKPSAVFVSADSGVGQGQGKILYLSFGEATLGIPLAAEDARGIAEDLLAPARKQPNA